MHRPIPGWKLILAGIAHRYSRQLSWLHTGLLNPEITVPWLLGWHAFTGSLSDFHGWCQRTVCIQAGVTLLVSLFFLRKYSWNLARKELLLCNNWYINEVIDKDWLWKMEVINLKRWCIRNATDFNTHERTGFNNIRACGSRDTAGGFTQPDYQVPRNFD